MISKLMNAKWYEAMGQLYRDRADCENGFNELKKPTRHERVHDAGQQPLPDEGPGP